MSRSTTRGDAAVRRGGMRTCAPTISQLFRMKWPAAMAMVVFLTAALMGCGLLPDADSPQDQEGGPATQGGAATTFTQQSRDPSPSPAGDPDEGMENARVGDLVTPTPRPGRESIEEPSGLAEESPTPTPAPDAMESFGAVQSGSRDAAGDSTSLSPEENLLVSSGAGRVVSGFIANSETGAPVVGATVHVVPDGGSDVTDESGFYRVSGVSAADHSVSVSHHGYEPARRLIDTSEEAWNRLDFNMDPRESAGSGKAYRVLGQVLDRSTGRYVEGAAITLSGEDGHARNASAGAEGEYTFAGLPDGAYKVRVEQLGYKTYTADITVDSDQARQILLSPEYASVEGRVLLESPDGVVPIPGAKVSVARDAEGGTEPVLDTTAGENGQYSARSLAPGQYRITASAAGLPEGQSTISVGPGESAETDVSLGAETSSLQVSLTSPEYGDMPVSGVTLRAAHAPGTSGFMVEAATGSDGVARLEGLPPGRYEVTTTDSMMTVGETRVEFYSLAETVEIAPGESASIQAELQPVPGHVYGWTRAAGPASIAAVIRSAGSDSEASGDGAVGPAVVEPGLEVSVSRSALGASDARTSARTVSDDFGNYSLSLPPGRHTLRVESGDGPFAETSVSVSSGQHVKTDLTLPPRSTAVAGHVKAPAIRDLTHDDEVVAPLSGARVTLSSPDDSYTTLTDGRGAFAFPEVALDEGSGEALPTEYALSIEHPDFTDLEQTVTLERTGGIHQLTRTLSDPESSGELRIRLTYFGDGDDSESEDQDGSGKATGGRLQRLKDLESQASYPKGSTTGSGVSIPDTDDGITLRARPGVYQARICPDLPGKSPCYEHEWISEPGSDETLDLEFECASEAIAISCRPVDDAPIEIEGDIFTAGLVLDAQTGKPVQGANVKLSATADAEYCTEDDECFTTPRDLKGSHSTDETGQFRMSLHVLFRDGPGEIVGWTLNDQERSLEVRAPGYEAVTLSGERKGIKGYASPFVVYLEPTGGIAGRVVSGTSERAAAGDRTWADTSSVQEVSGEPARVSFAHAGAVKQADGEGRFEVPAQRSDGGMLIEAAGHYPYRSSEAFAGDASDERYTFSLERIPGFSIQPGSFSINHPDDGRPVEGYVLTGGQAPDVTAQWRIGVDRGSDRPVRDGLADPVQAVDLVGEVVESCGGATGEPARVRFSGQLLEGEARGTSTWGGPMELASLPCGRIEWRVEASSGRFSAESGVDWRLWPSRPAGQLSQLLEASREPGGESGTISAGESAAVSVRRDGTSLIYVLDGLRLASGWDTSAQGIPHAAWLPGVSGVLESMPSLPLGPVTLNGGTGMLSVDASHEAEALEDMSGEPASIPGMRLHGLAVNGSLRQSVRAPALFSLETPVRPATSSSGGWSESVEGQGEVSVAAEVSTLGLPFAFRETIGLAADESFSLTGEGTWRVEDTDASDSAAHVNAEYEYSSTEAPGSGVSLGLRFGLETIVASEAEGDGPAQSSAVAGELNARRTLWDVWVSTSSVGEYDLQRKDFGEDGASPAAAIRQESEWLPRPHREDGETTGPTLRDGADVSVLARSGRRTGQASVAPLPDGGLLAAMVLDDPERTWPNSLGISVAQRNERGDWTEAQPLRLSQEGPVLDLALATDDSGQVVMVWSELRQTLDGPEGFVSDLASVELRYAVFDPASGDWTAARTLTDDARPDLSPVLAGNNGGPTLLAWTKDMDGNVLTEDDGVAYVSRWDGREWTQPRSLMPLPAGSGEVAASASGESAVVAAAQPGPDGQSQITLSFHTSGRWSQPSTVVSAGERDFGMLSVQMGTPGLASLVWEETAREGVTASRLVFAQASSAGLRASEEVAANVQGVTALDITSGSYGSPVITWADGGGSQESSVHTAFRQGPDWTIEKSVAIGNAVVNGLQTLVLPDGQQMASVMRIADEDGSVVGSRETNLPR